MADSLDIEKQDNEKQLNFNNNKNEVIKEDNNQLKDEEESQEIKSSDLVNCVSNPESESEKRCTSASNAGESEYESADDEELKQIDDNYDNTSDGHNQSISQTNEDNCVNSESESNNQLIDNQLEPTVGTEPNDNKTDEMNEQINCDINSNNSEVISKHESEIDSQNCEQIENSKLEEYNSNNSCVSTSDDKEDKEDDSEKKLNETEDYSNKEVSNEIEDLIDEESGGHEDVAELDEEYEDIEESDECSLNTDNEENEDAKHDSIDKENDLDGEREQGDGEESNDLQNNQKDKSLDHDEDKRNPQYIPKRGPFYEHDDRMTETLEATEEVVVVKEETPPKPIIIAKKPIESENNKKKIKKKLWIESERWGHDLFNEEEQIPKSKDELVNTYGYDIRNEDDAPKARRRRRYGRGPNKYTRQWQDENAYGRGRTSPTDERPIRNDVNDRTERLTKEGSGSERTGSELKERIEQKDRHKTRDRSDRTHRKENVNSNEFSRKKAIVRNDKPLSDNKRYESEESIAKGVQSFSSDDFPELPINDLRKKISSNVNQDFWKPSPRYSGHSSDQIEDVVNSEVKTDFKTEPMKIIEAIEHNNRSTNYNDVNTSNVVRTQTFENSNYSQRKSSSNYDYEEEDKRVGRTRNRKSSDVTESSGRAIRKTNNNLNYSNYSHGRELKDNYRNRSSGRSERGYHEESNRNTERYYEDDNFRNQRDRDSNFISDTNVGLQKLSIEDKSSVMSRNNESEQTRPKRYSSLRQQQRVIPESMTNITTNTQIPQTSDTRPLNAHQFFDSHPIQTSAYFADTSGPRNTYHPYITTNTSDTSQTLPSTYLAQQLPQRYIAQATASPSGDATRYLPATVAANVVANVVAASVVSPQIPQPLPQTVPPPPPPVISTVSAPPPPGTTYIPSFPSGYPQYPPPPPAPHVPPGYPGHVPTQQPTPLQLAELYRGGVTYYDPQSQQQNTIRQIPQRRPKAAIPIVPPPDSHSSDGDGDKAYVSVNS